MESKYIVESMNIIDTLSNNEIYLLGKQLLTLYWKYNDGLDDKIAKKEITPPKHRVYGLQKYINVFYPQCDKLKVDKFVRLYNAVIRKWPIAGVIVINTQNEILLVRNAGSKSWSFPKGKIEPNESTFVAGLRECYEETGMNLFRFASENRKIVSRTNHKHVFMYVIKNFNMDYDTPRIMDRKEIADIRWFKLNSQLKTDKQTFNVYINHMYDLLISYLNCDLRKKKQTGTTNSTPKETQNLTKPHRYTVQCSSNSPMCDRINADEFRRPTYQINPKYIQQFTWKPIPTTPSMENIIHTYS
jgi:8-oxo-dGTP pyrophosphatase MutT (NUDIX family)